MVDVELSDEELHLVDEDSGLDLRVSGRVPREWLLIALAIILAAFGLSDVYGLG